MPPEMFGSYDEEEDGGGSQKQAVTQAVDIYSFGLVLWQLLTGEQLDKFQGSLRQPRWVNTYQYIYETRTVFGRLRWTLHSFEDLRTFFLQLAAG